MEYVLLAALAAFAVYLTDIIKKMRDMTRILAERERTYFVCLVISAQDPNDLYSIPYNPTRRTLLVNTKALDLNKKINEAFQITENQNVFIEHLQVLN